MKSPEWQHPTDAELSPTDELPVCGDDGNQYESICQLVKVACERKKAVSVKYVGFCGELKIVSAQAASFDFQSSQRHRKGLQMFAFNLQKMKSSLPWLYLH